MENSKSNGEVLECLEQVCGPATGLELASVPKVPLSPGALLAQRYRLLEALGDSPQGQQFQAEDLRHQRRASLLVLSREFASDGLRLAALKDAVERVRQSPHAQLREVYGLETVQGGTVLVEEHAEGLSLLEVLQYRGALSAPEVVRLVNRLAPLVDHARAHRLEHVEFTLQGIQLADPGSIRQPLTAWPGLELKVNAIDFSSLCAPAGGGVAATQVGNGTAVGPCDSHVRLLGLLAYEALGGSRARVEAAGRYAPLAALGEEDNAVLRRALAEGWPSGEELARQLAASVGNAGPTAPVSEGDAAGGGQEALPQAAPADASKERPLRENRALHRALALGLVVLIGSGGYAWHHWANRRPHLPVTETPAPAAAGAVMPSPAQAAPSAPPGPAAATPEKAPEGGSELRPKARGRHDHRPRPLARPQPPLTFEQRLFGHKETKPDRSRP